MFRFQHIPFLLFLALWACSNPNSPESVAKEFYQAIQNKDIAKAKTLATEKSQAMLNIVGKNIELTLKNGKITNVDCVTENELSNCDCFIEGDSKPMPLSLLMEEGAWKVDIQSSAVNALDDLLDTFKDIDFKGILKKVEEGIDKSGDEMNELIEKIDIDEALNVLKDMDSSVLTTDNNIESLIEKFSKGLKN